MSGTQRVVLGVSALLIVLVVGYVVFFDGDRTLLLSTVGVATVFVLATLVLRTSR